MQPEGKKVLVAMSGGVDSSVAALLLKEKGYDTAGVTMCLGFQDAEGDSPRCCGADAVDDAKQVCERLGIKHYVIDFTKEMKQDVIDRFVREYRRGRTPNPCIDCNRYLKFGHLLALARSMGFDFLATGHYAKIAATQDRLRLVKPKDRAKDQTYFLYAIRSEDLSSLLFPLADRTKQEVRSLAREAGLPVACKTESQDICFVPRTGYRRFIRDLTGLWEPGPIVDVQGRERGRHNGIYAYTVGQRSGLGISAPAPLYVVSVDPENNRIVVGEKTNLLAWGLRARQMNLLAESWPQKADAKIRYRKKASACRTGFEDGALCIYFEEPQESITPGQAVVLYRGEEVLGGGEIEQVIYEYHEKNPGTEKEAERRHPGA
jgi:tRNA-specific 2-thiouridylase